MENRIEELEKKLEAFIATATAGFETADKNFDVLIKQFSRIDERFTKIEKELNLINAKIDKLDGSTQTNFTSVGGKLEDIRTEIQKINVVTGYKDQFDNQVSFGKQKGGEA